MSSKDQQEITYDIDAAVKRFGGDASLVAPVIEMFGKTVREQTKEIDDALYERDQDRLVKASHKVKGQFLTFDVEPPSTLAQQMESAAKAGELDTVATIWRNAAPMFRAACEVLEDTNH